MKKIVSVLLVTALVWGSLFAQVKLNYRTQANIVTYEKDKDKDKDKDGTLSFFNLHGDDAYAKDAKDTLAISLDGEAGGVAAEFDVMVVGTKSITPSKYYGWLNFGNLKFTAGNFDSRYTGRVQYGADYNGVVGEYVKLGGLKEATMMIVDADNFGALNGTGTHSMIADYTFSIGESDKLLVKAAVHEKDIKLNDTTKWVASSLGLAYSMSSVGTFEGIFRNTAKDTYVFGAYIRPNKLVSGLDAVAGFTMGMGKDAADKSVTEMGIDVRAIYKLDALTLGTNMNFTKYTNDKWGTWVGGIAAYALNDTVTAKLVGSYIDESNNGGTGDDKGTKTVNGLLGAEFTAMKNAKISTGVEVRYDLDTESTKVYVPCILRVKL